MKKKSKAQQDKEFWYAQGKRDGRAEIQRELRKLLDVPTVGEIEEYRPIVW